MGRRRDSRWLELCFVLVLECWVRRETRWESYRALRSWIVERVGDLRLWVGVAVEDVCLYVVDKVGVQFSKAAKEAVVGDRCPPLGTRLAKRDEAVDRSNVCRRTVAMALCCR